MIIQTPSSGIFDAAHVTGWSLQGSQEVFKGAIIVKAAYDIIPGVGASPRTLEPAENPDAKSIIFQDVGSIVLDGTTSDHFDLTYESDIAIEKPRTDIVVQGYIAGTNDGSVSVDGNVWFNRAATVVKVEDTARNLFGFQSKTTSPRALGKAVFIPNFPNDAGADNYLPNDYNLNFANFYKREAGFSTPGNRNVNRLTSGSVINIHKTTNQSDTAYSVTLPAYSLTARYRTYCGHGLDQAPYWRIVELGDLELDTLIVAPDDHTATLLWRSSWRWDQHPPDTYRKIQIFQVGG